MRIKQIIVISLSVLLVLGFSDLKQNDENLKLHMLTADSIKYWDPYYLFDGKRTGKGWILTKEKAFIEYRYTSDGIREELNYGDIIWDGFSFNINDSIIEIIDYNDYKFKILKITEDSLVLKDISKLRYTYLDSFLLVKSKDQITNLK